MQTFKTRSDFQRVRKGKKWVTPAFILQGLARAEGDNEPPRFGFTVSSKAVAKESSGVKRRGLATSRNRARRRLKEAVRLTFPAHAQPGFDYAIVGRGAALTRNFASILADMQIAFHKVSQHARSGRDRTPIP